MVLQTKLNVLVRQFLIGSFSALILIGCGQKKGGYIAQDEGESVVAIPDSVDFSLHIKPILSDRCFACHGPDKNAIEGGLSLHKAEDAYAAIGENKDRYAIVPGDLNKSELVNRILSEDPNLVMPPLESNLTLSTSEKELLKKWIEQGAVYKKHWAFVPPESPSIPNIDNDSWSQNEIDKFVLQKLGDQGFTPSEQASKEQLIRRAFFSIVGLPPSAEQVTDFVNNTTPNAYEQVIDSLLGTSDYAEYMAADWMDVARYADTHGYQDDFERIMWPWRDWVIHAFNKNMPYDEFVTYQLAGDMLPNASKESILATGFNRNHKITAEGGVIPEEYRIEYVEDRTNTFGTAFLGLTLECSRCHDHKYDPVSQEEHFQLFSFFNNVDEDGLMANAQVIPKPYINISKEEANGVLDFVNMTNTTKDVKVMVMQDMSKPRDAFVLNRGAYDQLGDQVHADTPEAIMPFPEDLPKNRLGLAKWLFHDDNPLTARVSVNRIWQRMFGKGLVESSYDFGNQGALPSHPKLLDYLAIKYRTEGWDMKKMIKYMAMSATFQQSSAISDEMREKDPENTYLARATRLRLGAEMIRDQALKLSGLLNPEIGGPSVKPYQPDGIWEETTGGGGGSTARYIQSEGKDLYRKSLYTFWKRTVPPPSMMTFDAASRDLCTVKRQETNTPLQALVLLNDPQLIEAARAMASKALVEDSLQGQIGYIFQNATSRRPDTAEMDVLQKFYEDALAKIESGEIIPEEYLAIGEYEPEISVSQETLTALSLTAQTIFNLDETITRG
ncbi:PSD1 and planctomycete cytochrome C domain-containing protein [Muricauda sp. 2012CJ35-5]|uniref:PSD1 and planctomycete cytochrome C domain-containing protein n=1 Tax=Flagellimonas spongiicola TaxID=2942208 RepID=A0ABT0PTE6_9FLAO|nr:PSD1 and planctomycete cytochrome C domain-containing protein [Allomuricauda spongiicola]MCL6274665.1 PSD1 and planctomycete cytochrome C domain-containing protein [Allomuricauda spongiicola]